MNDPSHRQPNEGARPAGEGLARRPWATVDLGLFTDAELRVGGINSRGFLQPLLPAPDGVDQGPANRAAAEGLASRGLLRQGPSGWRPVGRYEQLLEAAAVARSLVAVGPAGPTASGFGPPRLTLGCLGRTALALDLCPENVGYRAGLGETPIVAGELAEYASRLAGLAPGGPDRRAPTGSASAADRDPGWARVETRLGGGVPTVRIEAASISRPTGPLRQHRLTAVVGRPDGDWLLIGMREGQRAARRATPVADVPLAQVLEDLLSGRSIAV